MGMSVETYMSDANNSFIWLFNSLKLIESLKILLVRDCNHEIQLKMWSHYVKRCGKMIAMFDWSAMAFWY